MTNALGLGVIVLWIVAWQFWPRPFYLAAMALLRRAAGLRTQRVQVDGQEIVYLDGGTGETLVLLHGFGADRDAWPPMVAQLKGRYRVIAPDLPGFGDSSRVPAASHTLDAQLARLADFLRILGIQKCHLAGNSMGGYLAAHYAARHPEQIQSLSLLAPAGVASAQESELQQLLAQGDNPLLIKTLANFSRLMNLCFVKTPYTPGAIRRVLAARAIRDCAFHRQLFADLFGSAVPLEEVVSTFHGPTLILWGDHDRLLDVSGAGILHTLMPNSQVCVLPDVGHVPMLEVPRATALAFLAFQSGA